MAGAPQGTFAVIPEISHSDISYIIKNRLNRQLFFGLLRKMKYMYAELQEKRIIGSIFLRRTKTTNIGILR